MECSCEMCADDRFFAWIDSIDHTALKPRKKKAGKKKSSQTDFYKRWMNGDPTIGPLGEDNGKFIYLVDYSKQPTQNTLLNSPSPPKSPFPPQDPPSRNFPPQKKPNTFPHPCYKKISKWVHKNPLPAPKPILTVFMVQLSSSTEEEFPPL